MYSIIFQLAGSLVITIMVISRSKQIICDLSKVIYSDSSKLPSGKLHSGVKRLALETWLSRLGFGYLLIGYLIQLFKITLPVKLNQFLHTRFISGIVFIILVVFALLASILFVRLQTSSLERIYQEPTKGQVKIE